MSNQENESLENLKCYTAVVFWTTVKQAAEAVDYIKRFCNGQRVYMRQSVARLWICEHPDNANPKQDPEEAQK